MPTQELDLVRHQALELLSQEAAEMVDWVKGVLATRRTFGAPFGSGGLVFVGELWIGTALWVGVGLLLSAAAIWIGWSDFIRGPVQRQRERAEAAIDADPRTP
jgi:hypothetical protein